MADPDSRAKSSQHPRGDCDFIRELIQEMVHDRCFCEPGSREFVEFDSAVVEHFDASGKRDYSCELYRVTARVKFSGETCVFPLIVKLPQEHEGSPPSGKFQNEEMFYTKMTLEYGTHGVPKRYLSDLGRYGRPVIVLEDLAARDYVEIDRQLDEDHLKLCVKALAVLHGRGLKLKVNEFAVFREFYAKLSEPISDKVHLSNLMNIGRRFLMDSCATSPSFEPRQIEKIRAKIDVMESLAGEINDVSTICHGRFTRDNALFKYENGKLSDVKMIDWETMKYCSPAIDFGLILFTNLPDESESPKLEAFCRNILRVYLDAARDECTEMDCELLERDIIAKLLYAWLFLCSNKIITDEELMMILRVLDGLGSLD